MTVYATRLTALEPVAERTMALHIEKPAGFEFRAGQACDVILKGVKGADGQEARHAFSIVTAPHENELMFATRMRDSAYKNALGALKAGAAIDIDGPFGSLTLHKNPARAGVFIAGGIGITPFMSMIRAAAHAQSPQQLALLYSNRRPEDAAFLGELQDTAARFSAFRLCATMTDMAHSSRAWAGGTGVIDGAFIKASVAGLNAPVFYIAGPSPMVEAMRKTLVGAGYDEDDVRSEEFFGY